MVFCSISISNRIFYNVQFYAEIDTHKMNVATYTTANTYIELSMNSLAGIGDKKTLEIRLCKHNII